MGKTKKTSRIKTALKKAGHLAGSAAGKLKTAVREFFINVNPGP